MTIWFTSDTHFGHKNILKFCADSRPFASIESMEERMIETWNGLVAKGDIVWHLGDFSFYRDIPSMDRVLARLNGQIHLITGNHDHTNTRNLKKWATVQPYKRIREGEQDIIMFHYPIETWDKHRYGAWQLHGHIHSSPSNLNADNTRVIRNRVDVGWDYWQRPINIEDLKEYFASDRNPSTEA